MALVKTPDVEEEFKKNPELNKSNLDMLREWHRKQPHLPPMSDFELILFLHSNYDRTEPTKIAIDTYFTIRTHVPELFSRWDPLESEELREVMKNVCCIPLPSTTPEGYTVIYSSLLNCDPSHFVLADSLKFLLMTIELCLHTGGTSPGFVIITDMKGTVFGHLARVSPMLLKKLLYFLQDAIPIRLKTIHYLNTVPFMDMFVNLAKPFMKKELMNKRYFHTNLETLSKHVPLDLLPNEYGGKTGPLKDLMEAQLRKFEEYRDWFQKKEMRKVTEAARPGKAKSAIDIFGIEGSFKKLDID